MIGKLLADWLQQRKIKLSHRQILLISGDLSWCIQQADAVLNQANSRCLLLSKSLSDFKGAENERKCAHIPPSQYKQQLGKEFDVVVYNAFDGIKPSALYAVEGTVAKSGLLLILCPDLSQWPTHAASARGIAFNLFNQPAQSLFIERMCQLLCNSPTVARISKLSATLPVDYANSSHDTELRIDPTAHAALRLSTEQSSALNALIKNTDNRSVGLITAKRGRGKSTLLGHLGAELVSKHANMPIFITAAHRNNCNRSQLEFEHAIRRNDNVELLIYNKDKPERHRLATLEYIAPDQLRSLPEQAILLIDEAAALSPNILLSACMQFDHVVMATTTAGYEGSGLGFNLRVLPKVHELDKSFIKTHLQRPIRWLENDGLERVFQSIFAPHADTSIGDNLLTKNEQEATIKKDIQSFKIIDKHYLIQHEHLLSEVFSLLIQSHYQTTPDDLMRILDAPDHHIAVLSPSNDSQRELDKESILAVAVIVHEGNGNSENDIQLLNDIVSAKRRINGHLVAQNLTSTLCDKWFFTAQSWRIMRIAVKADSRNVGCGSLLLKHVIDLASEHSIDFLSTSFGLTDDLLRFWHKQGFKLIKVGARVDTSSGEHSGMMIRALKDDANNKFCRYAKVLSNDAIYLKQHILSSNNSINTLGYLKKLNDDIGELCANKDATRNDNKACLNETLETITLNTHHLRTLQFTQGKRSFINAAASIHYFAKTSEKLAILLGKNLEKHLSKTVKIERLDKLKSFLLEYICSINKNEAKKSS